MSDINEEIEAMAQLHKEGLDKMDGAINAVSLVGYHKFIAGARWALCESSVVKELERALKDIRSYSLGSKADTCDAALSALKKARGQG